MRGFSLIELLVVTTIMAILAGIGFGIFSGVQKSARDVKRKADIDAITKAYEAKYDLAKGIYQPIYPSDFTSGEVPKEADGTDYIVNFTEGNKAFIVCSNRLEKDSAVYCKYSASGDISTLETPAPYVAPMPTTAPTAAPTAIPTSVPTVAPTSAPTAAPTPRPFKYAFVTNDTIAANFTGLSGADSICNNKASSAGLPGTYKAWLSDQSTSARSRLSQSSLPYKNVDSSLVANSWTDLTDGSLSGAFKNENGQNLTGTPPYFVWTNTDQVGNIASSLACNNWTGTLGYSGVVGDALPAAYNQRYWTNATTYPCDRLARLYCLEQ